MKIQKKLSFSPGQAPGISKELNDNNNDRIKKNGVHTKWTIPCSRLIFQITQIRKKRIKVKRKLKYFLIQGKAQKKVKAHL